MSSKDKAIPSFHSDDDAESFVSSADLSEYDLSSFKPMRFEVEQKSATLNMRLPDSLLVALKEKAKRQGIPYTRYVRALIEADITGSGR